MSREDAYIPPRKHLRKVLSRLDRLEELPPGRERQAAYLVVERDMRRIVLGLLGEWTPEDHDEDAEGSFVTGMKV